MSFAFGPGGISGGSGRNDAHGGWYQVFSQNSYPITSSGQTVFSQRTSVDGVDAGLSTGPYLVSINASGNSWYSETYIGLMQWFASETNDGDVNNITLHNSGHAQNGRQLYARTRRVGRGSNTDLQFQIWSSGSFTPNITIYVKRLG